MIIYISSDKGSILEKSNWVVKRYDRWKCDLQKFIKEEYVNIANTDCEMIVVDVYAMEKVEEILQLKDAFQRSIIVMLIPDDYRGTYPEGVDIIIKDENTNERLAKLLKPQNTGDETITKVGIWSENDELSIQFAISLLSFFYKKMDDICLVEISDEFILGKSLKQYKLKDEEGIKYKNMPIVHNAMIENCKMGIFTFIKKDSKRPFDMCDIPIEVISEKRIKVRNKSYNVSYSSRNYFKNNHDVFNKIFNGYITNQKSNRIENGLQIIKKQGRKIFFPASVIIAIFFLSIVVVVMISGRNKTYVNETTIDVQETITEKERGSEEITSALLETTQEETTKRKKKKKVRSSEEHTYTKPEPTYQPDYTEPEIKVPEPVTKKVIRKIGNYSESNALSSGKISSIRSSVCANLGGSKNSELMNLAKYMSANGLTGASSTYRNLTNGGEKNLSSKTCSINIDSDSQDDIVIAASKAASKIGSVSGSYGIGISSFRKTVGYKIYIVVVY